MEYINGSDVISYCLVFVKWLLPTTWTFAKRWTDVPLKWSGSILRVQFQFHQNLFHTRWRDMLPWVPELSLMLFGREFHRVGDTKENSTAKLQLTAEYDAFDSIGVCGLALALLA